MDDLLGRQRLERQGLFNPEVVARRIAEHVGPTRPPQAAVDAADFPALVRPLAASGRLKLSKMN